MGRSLWNEGKTGRKNVLLEKTGDRNWDEELSSEGEPTAQERLPIPLSPQGSSQKKTKEIEQWATVWESKPTSNPKMRSHS